MALHDLVEKPEGVDRRVLFEREVVNSINSLEKAVEAMSKQLMELDKWRTKIMAYVSVLIVVVPIIWHMPWAKVFQMMLKP